MMAILTVVFATVQISIFRALPRVIRKYLAYWPMMAVLINFMMSFLILSFTGTTHFMGAINFMSSIIFALYIYTYKRVRAIRKVNRGRFRFPGLEEGNRTPKWIF
jgi:hypothetical protein